MKATGHLDSHGLLTDQAILLIHTGHRTTRAITLLGLPIRAIATPQGVPVATDTEASVAMAGEAAGRATLFSCIDDDRDELNVDDQLVNLFVCTMSIVKRDKEIST